MADGRCLGRLEAVRCAHIALLEVEEASGRGRASGGPSRYDSFCSTSRGRIWLSEAADIEGRRESARPVRVPASRREGIDNCTLLRA